MISLSTKFIDALADTEPELKNLIIEVIRQAQNVNEFGGHLPRCTVQINPETGKERYCRCGMGQLNRTIAELEEYLDE